MVGRKDTGCKSGNEARVLALSRQLASLERFLSFPVAAPLLLPPELLLDCLLVTWRVYSLYNQSPCGDAALMHFSVRLSGIHSIPSTS